MDRLRQGALQVATVLTLLTASALSVGAELERLFLTPLQRQHIDLERQQVLAGQTLDVDLPQQKRLSDIHFQAIVKQPDGEPLLWINQQRWTLAQWREQQDTLMLDRLWLQDEKLGLEHQGQRWLLRANQVLNRLSGEVTELHNYNPLPPESNSDSTETSSASTEETASMQDMAGSGANTTASTPAGALLQQAAQLRNQTRSLPQ